MKAVIVIPTYNERDNILQLVPAIRGAGINADILVVDDNSPDRTADVVTGMQAQDRGLHLLSRAGKEGLGRAYLAGFDWALTRGYEAVVEMDADFSHRPEDLVKILAALVDHDFVVGSRWVPEGRTENWGLGRIMISRGGSLYSRLILGYPLRDWTGGFNAWKASTLKGMSLETVKSNGYSFQIELKFRALRKGFHGLEVPIVFADRRVGQSKMSTRIVLEALHRVWSIRAQN